MAYPRHIAVIPDGNRRFVRRKSLPFSRGHEAGAEKIRELIGWCAEYKIKELTIYALSTENYKNRSDSEMGLLFRLFERYFSEISDGGMISKKKIRANFIGRTELLPKKMQGMIADISRKTRKNKGMKVNFALMYDGKQEIIDAANRLKDRNMEINEKNIRKFLYLSDEPDLLIRTGQQRLSGFMLWQSSYTELVFLPDVLWPEFSKDNFIWCLEEFSRRKRNFGK